MAYLITQFPKINNIRFTKYPFVMPPNQTLVQFNQAPFSETIKPWQNIPNISDYAIPATFLDKCTIMVNVQKTNSGNVELNLLYNSGNISIANIGYKESADVVYNTYTAPNGDIIPLTCWLITFTYGDIISPSNSGIYYLELVNTYNDDVNTYNELWRSEPIFLQEDHINTVLIQSNYLTNRDEVIIDNWTFGSPVFYHRVEADIRQFNVTGVQYAYLQQDYDQVTQNSHIGRIWEFYLGRFHKVPDWVLERVTAALLGDIMLIDYKPFMRVADSNSSWGNMWKKEDNNVYPLVSATCQIREVNYVDATTNVNSEIELFDPVLFPFAVDTMQMRNLTTLITLTIPYQIYYTSTDIDEQVNHLNTVVVPANGMSGIFVNSSNSFAGTGSIGYVNGYGENWVVYGTPDILTQYWSMLVHNNALSTFETCNLYLTIGGKAIADMGDVPYPYTLVKRVFAGTGAYNIIAPYRPSGEQTYTVFYNDFINKIDYLGNFESGVIATTTNSCFSGLLPTNSTELIFVSNAYTQLANGGQQWKFNELLYNCANNLTKLALFAGIGTWVEQLFYDLSFPNLREIYLSYNCFNSTQIDNIFINFEAYSAYATTGYRILDVSGQTDSTGHSIIVSPTSLSYAARTSLASAGWILVFD